MWWVWLGAGCLLIGAVLLLAWSARLRHQSGLPRGQVLQSDMDEARRGAPLISYRYGLTGTPDYIVDTPNGPVPVEVKPTRTDSEPRESHLLQVLAYCLLLEEQGGKRPPHGLLRYSTETFKVDYNAQTKQHIVSVIEEMREAAEQHEVHRSHDISAKCRMCAYRTVCDEALQ